MSDGDHALQPNRIFLFRLALSKCLKNVTESLSEDEFMENITVLSPNVSIGRKLYKAMVKELYNRMNRELEEMLEENSLQIGLARISMLLEGSGTSQEIDAWRPPGDVELHLRSVDAERIKEEATKLEAIVNEMERENEILFREVVGKRTSVSAMNDLMNCTLTRTPQTLRHLKKLYEECENSVQFLAGDGLSYLPTVK